MTSNLFITTLRRWATWKHTSFFAMKLIALFSFSLFAYSSLSIFSSKQKIELRAGDKAPIFSLKDQNNSVHNLTNYLGKKVVLYYFPKADTPGWTVQACGFRDDYDKYLKSNIVVFGISYDSPKALKKFKQKWKLPFNLLSDSNKIVAKKYGANTPLWTKRITFVIDEKGYIQKIYRKINVNTHAEKILSEIN